MQDEQIPRERYSERNPYSEDARDEEMSEDEISPQEEAFMRGYEEETQEQMNPLEEVAELEVSSPDFSEGEEIPAEFTCDGDDINPQLDIKGLPEEAESMVLIVDDPDAPTGTFTHWVVFDIPAEPGRIDRNSVPGVEGENDFGNIGYRGPCPPSGSHRYFFTVYALDRNLGLEEGASRYSVEKAMLGSIMAKGSLFGTYRR